MLTKEALDALKSDATTERLALELSEETNYSLAMPENYKVENIEQLRPGRSRLRGAMETNYADDFISYVKEQNNEWNPRLFVDADTMTAQAFFNLGDRENPGHGDFTAALKLEPSAPLASLYWAEGQPRTQAQLAAWLEDWEKYLSAESNDGSNDEKPDIKKAISAVRKLTIEQARNSTHTANNLSASRSMLESVEASSSEGLPGYFELTCIPYPGFAERIFRIEMSVLTSDDAPKLKLRIVRKQDIQQEMGDELKTLLSDGLDDTDTMIYSGSFKP